MPCAPTPLRPARRLPPPSSLALARAELERRGERTVPPLTISLHLLRHVPSGALFRLYTDSKLLRTAFVPVLLLRQGGHILLRTPDGHFRCAGELLRHYRQDDSAAWRLLDVRTGRSLAAEMGE